MVAYIYALINLCSCRLARDEGAMHDSARAFGRERDTVQLKGAMCKKLEHLLKERLKFLTITDTSG